MDKELLKKMGWLKRHQTAINMFIDKFEKEKYTIQNNRKLNSNEKYSLLLPKLEKFMKNLKYHIEKIKEHIIKSEYSKKQEEIRIKENESYLRREKKIDIPKTEFKSGDKFI